MRDARTRLPNVVPRRVGRSEISKGVLCAVLLTGLWAAVPGNLHGQQPPPGLLAPPRQPPRKVEVPVPLFGETEPDLIRDPDNPVSDPSAELFRSLKQKRFEELKRQLDELSRHWPQPDSGDADNQSSPEEDEPPSAPPVADPVESPAPNKSETKWGPSTPKGDSNVPADDSDEHQPADFPPDSDSSSDNEAAAVEDSSDRSSLPPSEADETELAPFDGPIDRLSLATSLFGAGEFEVCLQLLDLLDDRDLTPDDRRWAAYLRACCHRKLKRVQEAQKLYRQLVADNESGWTGDMSRWWLDHIEERSRLTADLTRLSETLSAWENEVEQLIQKSD